MPLKATLPVALFLASVTCLAQQQNYVHLENGERIYGEKIRIRGSLSRGNAELELDKTKRFVVSYQVDHYLEDGILYKKGYKVGSPSPDFFKINIEGPKARVYFKTVVTSSSGVNGVSTMRIQKDYYYTKSDSLMTPMKLKNTLIDFSDNPTSFEILKKTKSLRSINTFLYVAGSALVIAGITNFSGQDGVESSVDEALFFSGVACFVITIPINKAKEKTQIQAIEAYNR